MFPPLMSSSTTVSEEATSICSGGPTAVTRVPNFGFNPLPAISNINLPIQVSNQDLKTKKKRNLPGNPDPDAEVIALSPRTLLATNRFICEVCNKGFQRDQNLQLHRRGHNLPWKLKQRSSRENRKRAYVCPEPSCVHHHPSRALGDLTGIKKHFCRKHGEKKWKCEKCSKVYAVQSDWKAHSKICGTREYRCDCGTLFTRKDSFITHRAFCDALAEESARLSATTHGHGHGYGYGHSILPENNAFHFDHFSAAAAGNRHFPPPTSFWGPPATTHVKHENNNHNNNNNNVNSIHVPMMPMAPPPLSATALLQKAASVGPAPGGQHAMAHLDMHTWHKGTEGGLTRDFLGLAVEGGNGAGPGGGSHNMLSFGGGGGVDLIASYGRDHAYLKQQNGGGGFGQTWGDC